jgi:glycosyltransferase involved in cell wall biosynthesis
MHISVILSTYNAPALLEKVLVGYSTQDYREFDLVIADDGSREDTPRLLERMRAELGLDITHVWHEDDGFRKCTILNKAIRATEAPYLLFSDGDCIPRSDFLSTHARHAERGYFLSGGYFKLPRDVSEAITIDDIRAGRACDPVFLRERGLPRSVKDVRLHAGPSLARFLDAITSTKATWNGHNASGWREDIVGANGFDERMKYGGEDRELGERLFNTGIRSKQIRHRAICVHLWHERGYVRAEDIAANRRIRRETARTVSCFTPYGIVKSAEVLDRTPVAVGEGGNTPLSGRTP